MDSFLPHSSSASSAQFRRFDDTRLLLASPAPVAGRPVPGGPVPGETGQELFEFALVIALLLTLAFGIIAFARAYNVYQSITRAAREGARVAVLPSAVAARPRGSTQDVFMDPNPGSTADAVFQNYIAPALRAANLDPQQVQNYNEVVDWLNPSDPVKVCGVTISFRYPYTFQIPFTSLHLATIHLSAHVQMRREAQGFTQTTTGGVTTTTFTCP
ncbi:MAG TPA: TadE/TadG family type IV pilus assembly protein [Candidatus Acidoferrales bacterium]|nr:TadE/TadG family type IV pilus assembly protein [Candidatus Acidoferrales bacterium]